MDTTGRTAEDVKHVDGAAKGSQNTLRKIVPTKPNAQTAKKTILHFQDLVAYTKKRDNNGRIKYKRNITFWKQGK